MCVNTMPKRKDISNCLREAIVAAINLGRVLRPFPNNEVHNSTVRKIIHKWKTFETDTNPPRSEGGDGCWWRADDFGLVL